MTHGNCIASTDVWPAHTCVDRCPWYDALYPYGPLGQFDDLMKP